MFGKRNHKKEQTKAGTLDNIKDEKINLNQNKTSILEKNRKSLKDFIACDCLDFTRDPRYAIIGDKHFMKNMYIGILPNNVNFASFLHPLYNFGNIDTSIFIKPIDTETAKQELSKQRTNLATEYLNSGGSINRADDMAALTQEAARLRDEIREGINKLYEVNIQSTLYEESERDLNNSADQLKSLLGEQDIGLKSAINIQEDAYRSNKPYNNNRIGEWHTLDKRSLAAVYPFTSNNINHHNGVLIGFNIDNGLPVFYDTFDISLDNYNVVVFAKAGGGKSTFIKMLSSRSGTLDVIQNVAIDIEPEYRDICETLGGINITISHETDTIINPFDVVPEVVKDKITHKKRLVVNLSQKINSVTAILLTMAKGYTDNSQYYNDITRRIINEAVKSEYNRVGLTEDPESLYEYREDTIINDKIVGGKVKKLMPTITTWYQALEKLASENKNDTYKPYYDYLLMIMADFTKLKRGGFTCFDGQSTVQLGYDIPFINFDLSSLNEEYELPLAQHIVTDYIWEQLVKTNSGGHKIRVIIDEAWRMKYYPEAIKFLIKGFRRARKKNTSFVVISQQFNEFYGEETKPIIQNADTKLFLPPDETSISEIREVFKLTEGETDFLARSRRGEGLLKVNNVTVKLQIEIPEIELDFIETNQNEKAKREMEKVKKEAGQYAKA